jgi:hypothetical protein
MAKRKRENTPEKIEKKLDEGFGQGIGREYKPWLTIQEVPSQGRVTRLSGIKIDRQHDLMSDLERNYFYIAEFADCIKDIREQFPLLPQEQTLAIAEELGIKHPADPKTGENIVMTTDFLLTVEKAGQLTQVARTIKFTKDIMDYRTIEKLEIERRYWKIKDIDWGIVTEKDIDEALAWNVHITRPFYNLEGLDGFENMTLPYVEKLKAAFIREIVGQKISVRDTSDLFDERMMLKPGTSISLFKHLIIRKLVKIDMLKRLVIDAPMDIEELWVTQQVQEGGI